jgi:hypothetical protein
VLLDNDTGLNWLIVEGGKLLDLICHVPAGFKPIFNIKWCLKQFAVDFHIRWSNTAKFANQTVKDGTSRHIGESHMTNLEAVDIFTRKCSKKCLFGVIMEAQSM